jgi:hypothetical protein
MKIAELEALLSTHEHGAWSPELLAAHDDHDRFPAEAVAVLDEAGFGRNYVLDRDSSFPEMTALIRAVARRDLTVAIAHGKTFLGSAPVWVAGTPAQVSAHADRVRAGEIVCWGLTERDHGTGGRRLAARRREVADQQRDPGRYGVRARQDRSSRWGKGFQRLPGRPDRAPGRGLAAVAEGPDPRHPRRGHQRVHGPWRGRR